MRKVVPNNSLLIPDSAELVFKGKLFEVYNWPQEMFDGSTETFEMLKRQDIVTVICIVDDKIIVLDEEQPHEGRYLGLPSGRIDPEDNSPLDGAKREVREETGYIFDNWRLYNVLQPHNKIEWFVNLYIAWGVKDRVDPHLDPGEKIDVKLMDVEEIKELINNKVGYFGSHKETFKDINRIEDILSLPEFLGLTVDR